VIRITGDEPLMRQAKVDFSGVLRDVSLAALPETALGDYVLVHAGIAISRIDESEAARVFEYLRQADELELDRAGAEAPA
jgi:hydrogenase expression/formation protein HypC